MLVVKIIYFFLVIASLVIIELSYSSCNYLANYIFQKATLIIEKVVVENGKLTKLSIDLFESGQNPKLNFTIFFPKDIAKVLLHFTINYADQPEDTKYQVEFFKATFDLEKSAKNMKGNYIVRELMKSLLQSMNFLYRFPIKSVSLSFVFNFDI